MNKVWSYPKCGRTWLKAAFGKLYMVQNNEPNELALERYTCIASFSHDISAVNERDTNLFIIRDPKDVVVSLYFQSKYRNRRIKKIGSMSEYVRSGNWKHKGPIHDAIFFFEMGFKCSGAKVVRYEDFIVDFNYELKQILDFFSVKYTDAEIEETVEWCRFDNLQRMASQGEMQDEAADPTDLDNPETFKFRVGKVGNYVNYLSKEDIEYIEEIYETREFKYE